MSDDQFVYKPRVRTAALESILRDAGCKKGTCTTRICGWRTPRGHGFTAPNPETVPDVPAETIPDLLKKVQQLDDEQD
jgi:hypothetical protein